MIEALNPDETVMDMRGANSVLEGTSQLDLYSDSKNA